MLGTLNLTRQSLPLGSDAHFAEVTCNSSGSPSLGIVPPEFEKKDIHFENLRCKYTNSISFLD